MTICPRCGTQNSPPSQACALCGAELPKPEPIPPAPARGGDFGRTLVGHATPGSQQAPGERSTAPNLGSTLLGVAPVGVADQRARTVLGLAPPPQPSAAPGSTTLAMNVSDSNASKAPAGNAGAAAASGVPPHTRTILGVARPGIAPINPGLSKPSPALPSEPFPSAPPPPPLQGPEPSVPPEAPQLRPAVEAQKEASRATPRKLSLPAFFLAGVVLALLGIGAMLYASSRSALSIEARATLDERGHEQLELSCPSCADGTRVRLASASAVFNRQKATLRLERPLSVGVQRFGLSVLEPGSAKARDVSLELAIQYRVRGDISAITESVPRLRVLVDAVPGSSVRVANDALALDARGHGVYDIDVSAELTGPESVVKVLDRRVAYSVKPPDSDTLQGEVSFRLGIVPLLVEAPGASITTEASKFVLAGRTQKGATVSVGERPLSVDAEGRFAQEMNVSKVGETTIVLRSSAANSAPRLVPIRVRRVASLAEEAIRFRAQATTSYAAIATDIERKQGWKVALDGKVLEAKKQAHSTLLVLDTSSGCPKRPCLSRIVHGAPSLWDVGQAVGVFGTVKGAIDGPGGARVPEIAADFLLKARP
jgi:hypothetical protein